MGLSPVAKGGMGVAGYCGELLSVNMSNCVV
jgi:hypothetical protein